MTLCDRFGSPPQHKEHEGSGGCFLRWVSKAGCDYSERDEGTQTNCQLYSFKILASWRAINQDAAITKSSAYVCVCMFITVYVRMHVHVCVYHRSASQGVVLHDYNHFGFWRQGLSFLPRTPDSVRLAGKWDLGAYWFPPSQHWDCKHMQIMGTELRSSGMQIEPFLNWSICPAPQNFDVLLLRTGL